jgi:hypothetical protein
MCVIIPSCCRIYYTSLGLVHVNTGRCLVIWVYCCSYTGISNHHNVSLSYLTYLGNSMCVIIPTWCRIHCTSLGLFHINTGHCHVIWFYCCSYTGISNHHNVSLSYLTYLGNSMCVIIPSWCRIHYTSLGLIHINTGPCHVIWFYCCSYTGTSNQHNVSPLLFNISTQFDVRYNPLLEPYTLHVTRIIPCKLCTLSCHMILLLFIYRYK